MLSLLLTIPTLFLGPAALLLTSLPQSIAVTCPTLSDLEHDLGSTLSKGSSISATAGDAPRWSLYGAPKPAFVVNVSAESDVVSTVRYCNKKNIIFLAQSQGNGWADTFRLGNCGLVINMAGLNKVAFNKDRTIASIGGGAQVKDMVLAAYNIGTRFSNPTCTCLGFLGAVLGGGIARSQGLYGQGVDQVLSLNVVTASGNSLRVNPRSHPDLWYAMRGAAPNFGIVTSAHVKAYPVPKDQNIAWEGAITFADDKLEPLIKAIYDLDLQPEMEIDFLFATSGPPLNTPAITAIPFFLGNASAARVAFASIFALGPLSDETKEIPYDHWGDFANSFCQKGMRKPAYGASLARQGLDPATWRAVYEEFKTFAARYPEAAGSSILAEYYSVQKAVANGDATSSYPFRDVPIHVVTIPQYQNSSFDVTANAWGARVRSLLRSTDGLDKNSTYINFAHGDEPLNEIYGEDLPKLQKLKKRYDPQNKFNQWFPLA
ncbi:MAG: hypothetical protein LQ349_006606 [Xanthoria aureola]|nr:MAG: hypothetical protein LQ349_006606 [Xanthoria aureola]